MASPPPQLAAAPPPPAASLQPVLTPKFCFDTTALQDFLRLSRASVDDSLSVHLNALITPSRSNPFNPASTSVRLPSSSRRQQIPASTCSTFKDHILFPSWKVRSDVIAYCSQVAHASDPTAVPALSPTTSIPDDASPSSTQTMSRNYWGKEQVVNERLDPYSAKNYDYVRETDSEVLKGVLGNEEVVEKIIRSRTWGILGDRCIDGGAGGRDGWEDEWKRWTSSQRPTK